MPLGKIGSNGQEHDRESDLDDHQAAAHVMRSRRRAAAPAANDSQLSADGGRLKRGKRAIGLGCVGDELAKEPQQRPGVFEFIEEEADVDVVDGMELELERGDNPEVAAASSNGPEQVRVVGRAGVAYLPVGGDHFG